MSPNSGSVLCISRRPCPATGARRPVCTVRQVDRLNSAINVAATVAALLVMCIGVSDDTVALASSLAGQSRAVRTPVASNGDSTYTGRGGGPSYTPLGSGGGHGRCRITVCWEAYHSAVDSSLIGLSLDDLFNAEAGNVDYNNDQSASSRSYDRLTMTAAYCSRQRVASTSATSSSRQQKRQGKAARRECDVPAEDHQRGDVEAATSGVDGSTGNERVPTASEALSAGGAGRRGCQTSSGRRRAGVGLTSVGGDTGRRRLCAALRSLIECIERSVDGCRGLLSYHSSRRLARANLDRCNCSADSDNDVDGSDVEPASTTEISDVTDGRDPADVMLGDNDVRTISDSCRYRNRVDVGDVSSPIAYSVCAVYGDPHIRTFDGSFQTCRVMGTWPLIDNEYITVQTTNVRMGRNGGTAISKVSVLVKPYSDCSAPKGRYLTYLAEDGRLPSDWDSDSPFLDADLMDPETDNGRHEGNGLFIDEVDPGEHVQICLAYIDTTVSLKLVGRYYSVTISAPAEVVRPEVTETSKAFPSASNASTAISNVTNRKPDNDRDGAYSLDNRYSLRPPDRGGSRKRHASGDVQLCVRGCPHRETVDLAAYFRRERQRIGRSSGTDVKRTSSSSRSARDRLPIVGEPLPASSSSSSSSSTLPLMSFDDAYLRCSSDGHLNGYFVDSCVFDLLNTGDLPFSQTAARGALVDLRRFVRPLTTSLVGDSFIAGHSRKTTDRSSVTSSASVSSYRVRLRYREFVYVVVYCLALLTTCVLTARRPRFFSVSFIGDFDKKFDCDR